MYTSNLIMDLYADQSGCFNMIFVYLARSVRWQTGKVGLSFITAGFFGPHTEAKMQRSFHLYFREDYIGQLQEQISMYEMEMESLREEVGTWRDGELV